MILSRESWAGIAYLLMKLPLGIVSFVLTAVLIPVSLALSLTPMAAIILPADMRIGSWLINTPIEAAPFAAVGVLLLFFSLHILNGMAWVHAQWAKLCLKRLPKN